MATRKQQRSKLKQKQRRALRSVKNRTPTPYPRTAIRHQSYMNVSETWVNGRGRRNVVAIRNGTGEKRVERLGPEGEVLGMQTRPLTPAEQRHILQGTFVPGLWRNCQLGDC
jgi:hypothetical protein